MITNQHNTLILTEPQDPDRNPAEVYVASLGGIHSTGGSTQAQSLRVVAQAIGIEPTQMNWGALRYQHTAAIRAKIAEHYSINTTNKILSALRQVLKHAWRLGQISTDDYQRAIDIQNVKGETLPAGRELSKGELLALMHACASDPSHIAGTRDAAIIGMLYVGQLRVHEACKMQFHWQGTRTFNPETRALIVEGKRAKTAIVYLTGGAGDALSDWIVIRGAQPGSMIYEIRKGGAIQQKGISRQGVDGMLEKRGEQAGILAFSAHDLRRSGITHMLDAGADEITVSKYARHKNINTTSKYDKRGERAKIEASNKLHLPYQGRN